MKQYVCKVVGDESNDLVILFPEDLLKALDLHLGEYLLWEINGKEIKVKKTNLIDSKEQ